MQSADAKLRAILAEETTTDGDTIETAVLTEATPVETKAVSAADSLAAALKGDTTASEKPSVNMEELKKQYPLLSMLQLNSSGQGPVIGYANYKDTADINKYLAMPEIKAELPKDLRLKWGVSPSEFDKKGQTFELYAIKCTASSLSVVVLWQPTNICAANSRISCSRAFPSISRTSSMLYLLFTQPQAARPGAFRTQTR